MSTAIDSQPHWLIQWMEKKKILLWGAADLQAFPTPLDNGKKKFPYAVSFVIPMNPLIMKSIQTGPNQKYADAYAQVNTVINDTSLALAAKFVENGFQAMPLAASHRSDKTNIKGDFPQKTIATRAGLGWVGRHCQLITRPYGSWVRLGAVFTDMELSCGPAMEKQFCGDCMKCVDACPAGALKGHHWHPGLPRRELIDVNICDKWKKDNYYRYHKGHNCGICSSVCPYGLKTLKNLV